jgi:hypothetical protein
MGFEPTTLTLARLCSTPELHPRSVRPAMLGTPQPRAYMPVRLTHCKPVAPGPEHAAVRLVFVVGLGAEQELKARRRAV